MPRPYVPPLERLVVRMLRPWTCPNPFPQVRLYLRSAAISIYMGLPEWQRSSFPFGPATGNSSAAAIGATGGGGNVTGSRHLFQLAPPPPGAGSGNGSFLLAAAQLPSVALTQGERDEYWSLMCAEGYNGGLV